jgi:Putative prokaryotic signal transducing protein
MTNIDPEQELARMAAVYAAMSDEELREAGENPAAMTDWAFQALREEMEKRGLEWAGKNMPLPSQMATAKVADDPGNRPVVLRRYRDMPTAFVEKSVLDATGIECFLQDDNVVRMDWLWSNAMGGIKLLVREKDAEEAETILSQTPLSQPPSDDKHES